MPLSIMILIEENVVIDNYFTTNYVILWNTLMLKWKK